MKALSAADWIPSEVDAFDELDEYSLLGILEKLEFGDLAILASMNPRINRLIWEYNLCPWFNPTNETLYIQIFDEIPSASIAKRIPLCNGQRNVLATLKAFCPMFSRLSLYYENAFLPSENSITEIMEHINRYCATVPQQIRIGNTGDGIKEFVATNAGTVSILFPETVRDFSIGAYFPQVEVLSIKIEKSFAINEHLPHLKRLELEDSGHKFELRAFAELNPQIRSVRLDWCEGWQYMQQVNEFLPN